jgi:hypothetical protein
LAVNLLDASCHRLVQGSGLPLARLIVGRGAGQAEP